MTGGATIAPLRDASAATCGGKAATLAVLMREGLPVPDGFVVTFASHRAARAGAGLPVPAALQAEISRHLARMGDPPVAVRSSAANEDTARGSAAGQYESVLAVRGAPAVAEATRVCWASSSSARATGYWGRLEPDAHAGDPDMAVLVQRLVDADAAGVMFTPARPQDSTRIEASWGLGLGVVGGTVTPDSYVVETGGGIRRTIAHKTTRRDRDGTRVVAGDVPRHQQTLPTLDDAAVTALVALGHRTAALLDQPQDVEWAIAGGTVWILQARPITASPPPPPPPAPGRGRAALLGTPAAHGIVTGIARVLHGPSDFARVRPGDIAICVCTDPAWTPLFGIAAAVVTETGGVLSHTAIVAREHGIPAVLGIPDATTRIHDGARITVDGTEGTVTAAKD